MPDIEELSASVSAQRHAFLEALSHLRPRLHRYCSRMTGSVLEGEDVVQEVLGHAFFRLHTLDDTKRLEPWLFRIAHNKAIDHIRKRKGEVVGIRENEDEPAPEVVDRVRVAEALTRVVTHLPPKERACVVLKDVLDYSLQDIADIVDSTVGGVKAALHRGRGKLSDAPARTPRGMDDHERRLIAAYVDRFNVQDWDGVEALLGADARLEVVDRAIVRGREAISGGYFTNYQRLPWRWQLRPSRVDGVEMLVHWRRDGDSWRPHAPVLLRFEGGRVSRIRDFVHVEYLLDDADVDVIDEGETNHG